MINTVLGKIDSAELGLTLGHEHIMIDSRGADNAQEYKRDDVVSALLPSLLALKRLGCQTLIDATPNGLGRDINVLVKASEQSGLNIITCVGAWDGMNADGKFIPDSVRTSSIDEIVGLWSSEFYNGVDNTDVKPGFIKIALGDNGMITELQSRLLYAAIRTSLQTDMPIQFHCTSATAVQEIIGIAKNENIELSKLIWLHCDTKKDDLLIKRLAKEGIWVSFDYALARAKDLTWYITMLNSMIADGSIDRLLVSQDHDIYDLETGLGTDSVQWMFTAFIPLLKEHGFSQEVLDQIFVINPSVVFDI